jgi:hypothetical protein
MAPKKQNKDGGNRWNQNSKDGRKLQRLLRNNKIDKHGKPSAILHSLGWQDKYSSNTFRTAFHRLRDKLVDTELQPRNTTANNGKMVNCQVISCILLSYIFVM